MNYFNRIIDKLNCLFNPNVPRGRIRNDEPIAYYIFSKGNYRSSDNRIKAQEFVPSKKSGNKSVFRIDHLSFNDVKKIGKNKVLPLRKNAETIYGHVQWMAEDIYKDAGLDFHPDNKPWCRHANIVGWPDSAEAKKDRAKILAAVASELQPY